MIVSRRILTPFGALCFTGALMATITLTPIVRFVDDPRVFELDGNAVQDLGKGGDDWSKNCSITNTATGANNCSPNGITANAVATTLPQAGATWEVTPGWPYVISDQALTTATNGCRAGTDPNTFGGGSKDTLDISQNTYNCSPVQAKSDIQHGYAAAYQVATGDTQNPVHTYIYFGADVLSTNGDGATGIWFLQSSISVTNVTSTKTNFVGNHVEGDLFIVSPFTIGGGVSTINVYYWHNGALTPFPNLGTDNAALCNASNPSQTLICAIANSSQTIAPWPYQGVQSGGIAPGVFPVNSFVEGGFDLTGLFESISQAQPCFSTIMLETRSSQSLTATLEDFLLGSFQLCSISAAKACGNTTQSPPQLVAENGGTFVRYTFTATVTNTGPGEVYKPMVTDVFPSNAIHMTIGTTNCSTTACGPVAVPLNANGCTSSDNAGLQHGECAAITGSFDVPTDQNVTNSLGDNNHIGASAAPALNGGQTVIAPQVAAMSAVFGPGSANTACSISPSPNLSLTNTCSVGLNPTSGGVVLQLLDQIQVCNISGDSTTTIKNITLSNAVPNITGSPFTLASSISLPNASTCTAANPNCNCATFSPTTTPSAAYTPTACNGGPPTLTGGRCFFTNTVSITSVPTDEFSTALPSNKIPGAVIANMGAGCSVCPFGACQLQ